MAYVLYYVMSVRQSTNLLSYLNLSCLLYTLVWWVAKRISLSNSDSLNPKNMNSVRETSTRSAASPRHQPLYSWASSNVHGLQQVLQTETDVLILVWCDSIAHILISKQCLTIFVNHQSISCCKLASITVLYFSVLMVTWFPSPILSSGDVSDTFHYISFHRWFFYAPLGAKHDSNGYRDTTKQSRRLLYAPVNLPSSSWNCNANEWVPLVCFSILHALIFHCLLKSAYSEFKSRVTKGDKLT